MILQRYIFRELFRTFFLTAVGLTAILSMGGGVLNIVRVDDMTADELLRLMVLIIPMAATLTFPIATIFSAAATYGRLASDNEFLACRSSGVNIHRLLRPVLALSLAVSVVTFLCLNFFLPSIVHNLDRLVGRDIAAILRHRLRSPEVGLPGLSRYRLYTGTVEFRADEGSDTFILGNAAFVELGEDTVERVGTAREVIVRLDRIDDKTLVSGEMRNLRLFDHREARGRHIFQEERQEIQPNVIPNALPQKLKFLDLRELVHYASHPDEWTEVRDQFKRLRVTFARALMYRSFLDALEHGGPLILSSDRSRYEIRVDKKPALKEQGWLALSNLRIKEISEGQTRTITADRGNLEVSRAGELEDLFITLELYDNVDFPPLGGGTSQGQRLDKAMLPQLLPPDLAAAKGIADADLVRPMDLSERFPQFQKQQSAAAGSLAQTQRRIAGIVHQRMAFTLCIPLLGLLAAALGAIFSQSQILTAVGISMAPTIALLVAILTGKQLAEKAGTMEIGVAVIWGGLAAFALVDAFVLHRWLRR